MPTVEQSRKRIRLLACFGAGLVAVGLAAVARVSVAGKATAVPDGSRTARVSPPAGKHFNGKNAFAPGFGPKKIFSAVRIRNK